MKNQHLIPANIIDIFEKLTNPNLKENERANYVLRLETIRDYCDAAVKKETNRKQKEYAASWKATRDICS